MFSRFWKLGDQMICFLKTVWRVWEAAILTMIVEKKEKNKVLDQLVKSLNIDKDGEGHI